MREGDGEWLTAYRDRRVYSRRRMHGPKVMYRELTRWPARGGRLVATAARACGLRNPPEAQPRRGLWYRTSSADHSQSQLPANLRKITFQREPDDVVVNTVVLVGGQIPGTSDASPGHLRMRLFELIWETADGFTDPGDDRFAGETEGDVGVIRRPGSRGHLPRHVDEVGQVPEGAGKSFAVDVGGLVSDTRRVRLLPA